MKLSNKLAGLNHYDENTPVQIVAEQIYDALEINTFDIETENLPVFDITYTNYIEISRVAKKASNEYEYVIIPSWELLVNVDPSELDAKICVIVFDLYLYFDRSSVIKGISTRRALQNLKKADVVLPASNTAKFVLENTIFRDRDLQHFVPGVNKERFYYDPNSPEEVNLPEKYLLYVGSFDERKNTEFLLDVLEELPSNWNLVLGGSGYSEESKKRMVSKIEKLGLSDRVKFTGYVSWEDLRRIYSNAEVYLHPSKRGGFELTPMEAAACKTPVLVNENIPSSEVLDQESRFDEFNAGDIAKKIKSASGERKDYDLPSWKDSAEKIIQILGG